MKLIYRKKSKTFSSGSVKIKSDILECEVPMAKLSKLARKLDSLGLDSGKFITLKYKEVEPFICKVKLNDPDQIHNFNDDYSYYIEPCSLPKEAEEDGEYVQISNTSGLLVSNTPVRFSGYGYCAKSTDNTLDAYWTQHYARGAHLNVGKESLQVALAVILDASAHAEKIKMIQKEDKQLNKVLNDKIKRIMTIFDSVDKSARKLLAEKLNEQLEDYL